jgi:hypothetical protein
MSLRHVHTWCDPYNNPHPHQQMTHLHNKLVASNTHHLAIPIAHLQQRNSSSSLEPAAAKGSQKQVQSAQSAVWLAAMHAAAEHLFTSDQAQRA